jgi:DNA-binding response OmpR family regulator
MARILIIEDEEKMVRMLARVLREEGYVAGTAGPGSGTPWTIPLIS